MRPGNPRMLFVIPAVELVRFAIYMQMGDVLPPPPRTHIHMHTLKWTHTLTCVLHQTSFESFSFCPTSSSLYFRGFIFSVCLYVCVHVCACRCVWKHSKVFPLTTSSLLCRWMMWKHVYYLQFFIYFSTLLTLNFTPKFNKYFLKRSYFKKFLRVKL